ncbi:lipase member J-like [Tribolium madens]|uniref:lipase member J-like n=1 Tax=Tribolium madens TaxID=41895 RepID=UPI001CF740D6|nr:lipase member J-like [Tribolium madens]
MIIFLKIFIFVIPLTSSQINNACKNFESYFNIYFSSDCFYIPDNHLSAPEIIKHHVGVFEHHKVTTEDGYILGLFRIPRINPKGVILLQHGFVQDATCWVSQYNKSIAFWFWNAGYDVWMTNSRGTFYSKKHINLTSSDEEFWNFTFHEIGYYDLDAVIKHIKLATNRSKLIILANSMGFTSSLVYASMKCEQAAENVQILIGLAPVWSLKYTKSLHKWITFPYVHFILKSGLNRVINWYSFPEHDEWMLWSIRLFNKIFPFKKLYVYLESLFYGWSKDELDPSFINMVIDHFGAPSSLKNYEHIYQISNYGEVRMFDYGNTNNLVTYGSETPPPYALENVSVPILLIYGTNDYLTQAGDIDALYQKLPEKVKVYEHQMAIDGFSHTDFYYGKHRYEMLYKKLIEFLDTLV